MNSLWSLFPPVSLWLFGAHVGVRRLLGDKDTANLAQLLVHLKVKLCKMQFKTVRTEHQNIRTFKTSSISAAKWEHPRRNHILKTDLKVTQALFTSISMAPLPTSNTLLVSLKMSS